MGEDAWTTAIFECGTSAGRVNGPELLDATRAQISFAKNIFHSKHTASALAVKVVDPPLCQPTDALVAHVLPQYSWYTVSHEGHTCTRS